MRLSDYEKRFLVYYLNNYNAKWMRVFNNKHPFFCTRADLYTIYKRMIRNQPVVGQKTYPAMIKQLTEGKWYYIPELLKNEEA